jgi:tetratricopeptide (TPR) repeat protein
MLEAAGDLERCAADAEHYLELMEYSASACNDAAWIVARNHDVPPELTEQALLWARRAVESAPTRDDCRYTCGVAEYRVGHWEQAIEAFHKSSTLIDGRNLGWNAFFLAMAEHQLGHAAQSDLWYRAGLSWMSEHDPEGRDLIRFREEAAQLLTGNEPTEPDSETPTDDIASFTLAIEAAPDAGWAYSGRARAHLEQEHWSEAAADIERGLVEAEPRFRRWYELGLLQAYLGDAEGYRDTCSRMIDAFGEAEDATSRHFAVWTSALVPAALDDCTAAVEIASAMAAESAEDPAEHQNLGVILYRADRAEEALAALTEAERLRDAGGDVSNTSPAYLWYLLSIVHADLGNQDESRDWLAKANERADQELADADNPVAWFRKLTLELLRTEAEGMVAEAESSRSDPSD